MRIRALFCALSVVLATTAAGLAAEFGTEEEARALLDRAVAEVEADEAAALEKFNSGADGYRDRDLYVFCFAAESGEITAHPTLVGRQITEIEDVTGFALGQEMFDTAADGVVSEVSYMWPRPDETEPVQKHSFVTRIGDQACGVGYYE